jgi:glycosyltransferase involved in cell wall biosynthesis
MKTKKILLISPFPFFKRNFGGAVRVYYLFQMLSRKFEVFSIELGQRNLRKARRHIFRYRRKFFFLDSFKVISKIRRLYTENDIKLAIFSMSDIYMSFISLLLRIFIPRMRIVIDAHNVEYLVQKFKRGDLAALFTLFFEKLAFNFADKIFCVSEKDKKIIKILTRKRIIVLPNCVDISMFKRAKQLHYLKKFKPLLVFHGLIAYKPNMEALEFLFFILPSLKKQFSKIHLLIFGSGSENVKSDCISLGTISFNKIPNVLKTCDIAVVPIFHGSGTRLKILEYMAAGVPIVATPKAVEGLNLIPFKHYLPANNKEEFIFFIEKILKKQISIADIRKNTLRIVKKYDWKTLSKTLITEVNRC